MWHTVSPFHAAPSESASAVVVAMRSSILTLAAVCLLVGVVAATRVPESWELLGRVENDARVPVLIAVAHGKDASVKLENQCMAVSDPASASYVCHCAPHVRCGPWPPRCWWWSATQFV